MEHSGLNAIDLAVFGTILLSGLLALMRGFVREVLALAAWTGAGIVTVYFYPILRPWMHAHIKTVVVADVATGLILFCVALAILIPLGHFLSGLVRGRALTAVDRSLGFVFGLARGLLVVCLLFLLTLWLWPDKEKEPEMLAQAKTRPFMASGAETLKDFLPQEDIAKVRNGIHEVAPDAMPNDDSPAPAETGSADNGASAQPPGKP